MRTQYPVVRTSAERNEAPKSGCRYDGQVFRVNLIHETTRGLRDQQATATVRRQPGQNPFRTWKQMSSLEGIASVFPAIDEAVLILSSVSGDELDD